MDKTKAKELLMSTYYKNFDLSDLIKICEAYFGEYHSKGKHPYVFTTVFADDPIINLQPAKGDKGKAKPYQVKQVRKLVERFESEQGGE
jgi:hypothetical protein